MQRRLAAWTGAAALLLALVAWPVLAQGPVREAAPRFLPTTGITAGELGLVVNDADPASIEIAAHYASARGIAPEQVVHLAFPPGRSTLTADEFRQLKAQVDAAVPARVQAFALAWTEPYRVDCMSITAAFAFGFDPRYCADGCRLTQASPYYDSDSHAPFRDLGMRPTMMLAADSVAGAKTLIDRGVRSDDRWPDGTAYLLRTGDHDRNVRAAGYEKIERLLRPAIRIETPTSDALRGRSDVMFYFTGLAKVPAIESNRFLDGAIADHLTSAGGVLVASPQMSALEWLHAGATGSYGTAFEPCAFVRKFPDVGVVMSRYLTGETLIEAYWKSVLMPGQGVFVGEPLARPYGGVRSRVLGDVFEVRIHTLRPGRYWLQAASSAIGPFRNIGMTVVRAWGAQSLRLPATAGQVYRLVAVGGA